MSYKPGDLKILTPCAHPKDAEGYCDSDDYCDYRRTLSDARTKEGGSYREYGPGSFYLEHSCDEWVIGDRADAEALHADLSRLLGKEKP
jgi:hypothetical protein